MRVVVGSIALAVFAQAVRADAGPTAPGASSKASAKKPECTVAQRVAAAQVEFKTLVASGFCLPGMAPKLDPPASDFFKDLFVCSTAACPGKPNTCSLTLGSTTLDVDPKTLAFKGTTDITVKGGASAKLSGALPLSCKALVMTAPKVSFSGTLALSGQGSSLGLVVSTMAVSIDPASVTVSGCGLVGQVANHFASSVVSALRAPAAEAVANGVKGPVFGRSCSG